MTATRRPFPGTNGAGVGAARAAHAGDPNTAPPADAIEAATDPGTEDAARVGPACPRVPVGEDFTDAGVPQGVLCARRLGASGIDQGEARRLLERMGKANGCMSIPADRWPIAGKEQLLRQCRLFARAGDQAVRLAGSMTLCMRLAADERICVDAAARHWVWLICDGLVELAYADAEGRRAVVLLLDRDDGWVSLEDLEEPWQRMELTAVRPATLLRSSREELGRLFDRYPEVSWRFAGLSLARIQRLQQRLAEVTARSVSQRLAAALLGLSARYGRPERRGGRRLGLSMGYGELAGVVGGSRRRVARILGRFRRAGWIGGERRRVEWIDERALAAVGRPVADTAHRDPRRGG